MTKLPEQPTNRDRMLPSPEMGEVHRQAVRAVTNRIRKVEEIVGQLTPTIDQLTSLHGRELGIPDTFSQTGNLWLAKGPGSNIEGQLQSLGGQRDSKNDKTLRRALARELQEEGNFFGINPELADEIIHRNTQMTQADWRGTGPKKISSDETFFVLEVPSFINPFPPDADTKAKAIVELSPQNTESLFDRDEIELDGLGTYKIMDSLSLLDVRKTAHNISSDLDVNAVKEAYVVAAFHFEAQMRTELIDRLLEISTQEGVSTFRNEVWMRVKSKLPGLRTTAELKRFVQDTNEVLAKFENGFSARKHKVDDYFDVLSKEVIHFGVRDERVGKKLIKRALFLREISRAMHTISFEHGIQFIQNTGDQKPYVLTQLMLQLDTITSYEYEIIKRESPELAAIYDTALEVFGINPETNDHWFDELKKRMKAYRDLKVRANAIKVVETISQQDDLKEYTILADKFKNIYAQKLGIGTTEMSTRADKRNGFYAFIEKFISNIADPNLRKRMFPNPLELGTSMVDEIFIRIFGFNQYDEIKDATSESKSQRSLAHASLLLLRDVDKIEKKRGYMLDRNTYVFRGIFQEIASQELGKEIAIDIAPGYTFYKYVLSLPTNPVTVNGMPIDLQRFNIRVFSGLRNKAEDSLLRKHIERGTDMSDFFGQMVIIDADSLREEFIQAFPDQGEFTNEFISLATREIAAGILRQFKSKSEIKGEFSTRKEKARAGFKDIFRDVGIEPGDIDYMGSRADEIVFDWAKLVLIFDNPANRSINGLPIETELQILASLEDAKRKYEDDLKGFGLRRLFLSHRDGYFSFMYAMFGIHDEYPEVVVKHFDSVN